MMTSLTQKSSNSLLDYARRWVSVSKYFILGQMSLLAFREHTGKCR